MKLKTFDRLILLNILPAQGDIITLRIVRDLQAALGFTEAEHAALELKSDNGKVFWKKDADIEKDIDIGAAAKGIIADRLKELNEQKMLTLEHMDIYDKFISEA